METKKEERSEYITMYVTPSAAKEFKEAKDNKELQDSIIKKSGSIGNRSAWVLVTSQLLDR